MGWIEPIDSTTWAFYSPVPAVCLPSASSRGRLQTFNLGKPPLRDGAGVVVVLGSAQSHVHQLQQERAVPALLPSNPQPTVLSPQRWMLLQNQHMGTAALAGTTFPHSCSRRPQGYVGREPLTDLTVGFLFLSQGDTTGSNPASVLCTPT